MDFSLKTHLTRIDVEASGACTSGVMGFIESKAITKPVVSVKFLLRICSPSERQYVLRAANGNGYGYGYGYGNGYGNYR